MLDNAEPVSSLIVLNISIALCFFRCQKIIPAQLTKKVAGTSIITRFSDDPRCPIVLFLQFII
jgi:hypothetical protein